MVTCVGCSAFGEEKGWGIWFNVVKCSLDGSGAKVEVAVVLSESGHFRLLGTFGNGATGPWGNGKQNFRREMA
ncbi:MAG: hypothetical protein ACTS6G_04420 [Candidatus Hodgkinia cicadicola]